MLNDHTYNTFLQQYRAPPFRFKTRERGDGIWVISSRDGGVTIQPNDLNGRSLCLAIVNKGTLWAKTRLATLPFLVPVQGSFGESVHSFARARENVLAVASTFKMLRKREMSEAQATVLAKARLKLPQVSVKILKDGGLGEI